MANNKKNAATQIPGPRKKPEATSNPAEAMPLSTLLTIPQVAAVLGLGRKKVYQLIYFEGLPIMKFGRAVRINPTSLKQWIARREQSA
jgi:excisionase family DNA binding protein